MKAFWLVMLFAIMPAAASAQDVELHHRPTPDPNSAALPDKPEPVNVQSASIFENLPPGMVLVSVRDEAGWKWLAQEQGTCGWCARPTTFKKAAFDKKMSLMWIGELGLAIADTEITASRPCIKNHTCYEGNPLLGPSRAQQYGVRIPVMFGAWMADAYLRKGNEKWHIGGLKRWWVLPMIYQAASAAGIAANLVR